MNRPELPRWAARFRVDLLTGVLLLSMVVASYIAVAPWSDSTTKSVVLSVINIGVVIGAMLLLRGLYGGLIWSRFRPTDGKVVDRYIEFSGFVDRDVPLDAKLSDVLEGNGFTEGKTVYWLQVKDRDGMNHWFVVSRRVFDLHPELTTFDAQSVKPVKPIKPAKPSKRAETRGDTGK